MPYHAHYVDTCVLFYPFRMHRYCSTQSTCMRIRLIAIPIETQPFCVPIVVREGAWFFTFKVRSSD